MSYLTQPIIYPTSPSHAARDRLRSLMQRAKSAVNHDESLRIGIIGDSTTTSFGGAGVQFHHAINNRLGGLFGNIAGTQIVGVGVNQNGGPFLHVVNNNVQASPFDATHQWPAFAGVFGGLPFDGETAYQPAVRFEHLGIRNTIADVQDHLVLSKVFPVANVRLELVGIKQAGSAAGVRVIWAPTNQRQAFLFAAEVASEDIAMGLNAANGGVVEMTGFFRTAPRTPPADNDPQWYLQSSEATTVGVGSASPPLLAGLRVLNANPVGAMVDTLSTGSYQTVSWFGDTLTGVGAFRHNAAAATTQLRHDVLAFAMGANDIYSAGRTAADIRRNYYDADGTNNKGLIGELIDEYESREIPVPLIVLVTNPFRADNGTVSYSAAKATQHALLADELVALADELNTAGYHAMVLNAYRYTYQRGFTAELNDLAGLTDRGAYSTVSVAYAVDDYYTGTDGKLYRCNFAHTSSATTEPTDTNSSFHTPLRVHLDDEVHWSRRGSELMADAYEYLLASHYDDTATSLTVDSVDAIADAVLAKFPSNSQTLMYLRPAESRILTHDFGGTVTGTPTAQLYIAGSTSGSAVNGVLDAGSRWRFTVPVPSDATKGASAWIRLTATVDGDAKTVDLQSMIASTSAAAALSAEIADSVKDGLSQGPSIDEPAIVAGQITSPIIIGDDYLSANGRAFAWTIAAITGVTPGTATTWFGARHSRKGSFLVQGSITDNADSTWTLSFDVTKADTQSCEEGEYEWSVAVHDASGNEITKVRNDGDNYKVKLIEKQT